MKPKFSIQVTVGAFVIAAIAVLIATVFILGDGTYFFKSDYTLKVKFNDITGLRLGSPVFLNGYNIGKVDQMNFGETLEDRQFTIFLKLLADYQERIREDSVAKIDTQGLLGDKAITITVGNPDKRKLEDWDYITVKENISFNEVAEKGSKLIDKVDGIIDNVGGIINDVKTQKSLVNSLLYDPEGARVIRELNSVVHSAGKIMNELDREKFAQKMSSSADNLQKVSKNFNQISGRIEKGEGSLGGFINDPTVYYDLKTLLGKANRSVLIKAVIRHTLSRNEKQTLK